MFIQFFSLFSIALFVLIPRNGKAIHSHSYSLRRFYRGLRPLPPQNAWLDAAPAGSRSDDKVRENGAARAPKPPRLCATLPPCDVWLALPL